MKTRCIEQLLDNTSVQNRSVLGLASILRGEWVAQAIGVHMETAMKSSALWNSPWSVEMETNFQLTPFLRLLVRTCEANMTSLSNFKRANASISYLQGVCHWNKRQSWLLDWEKKLLATEIETALLNQSNGMKMAEMGRKSAEPWITHWRTVPSVVQLTWAYVSTGFGLPCVRVKEVNKQCHKAQPGERVPIVLLHPLWCVEPRKVLQPHQLREGKYRHWMQVTDWIDYRIERQENNIDKRGFKKIR